MEIPAPRAAEPDYDLVVLGSGPGGQKAAITAAKLGRRVCLVERRDWIGGVCTNTGTIPSKTLREAAVYLTGLAHREVYGVDYRVKDDITVADLFARTGHVVSREIDVILDQLRRNHVEIRQGTGRFLDPHTIAVEDDLSHLTTTLTASRIVIATGSRPVHPPGVVVDGRRILDSDGILSLTEVPRSMLVIGAGVIGMEYASVFATLGAKVTVIDKRPGMLEFCDPEVVESLRFHLRDLGVSFRLGEEVESITATDEGAVATLASGKRIPAGTVLYSAGRQGQTAGLDLDAAGLEADHHGRIPVDEHFRTRVPHVYAVGDVIGFPALAATSMDQGRLAASHAFGEPARHLSRLQPFGIYTIPEISYCGRSEEQLTLESVPYEVGIARYRELARGQIVGDTHGMLKLLVHAQDRTLLGVHAFGTAASEIVHIGQAIMAGSGTIDYLVDTVLNYPTLSEAYKVAALDAATKLRALERASAGAP